MKKIILLTIISLFAFSANAAELKKIGYVNMNRALNECDKAKGARKTLENMLKNKEERLAEKLNEINKFEEETFKQISILTPDALREKQYLIKTLKRDYRRLKEDLVLEAQNKQNELTLKITSDLRKLIIKIGKEEGYTAIFDAVEGSSIIYMPKELDLTEDIIKRYNEISINTKNK